VRLLEKACLPSYISAPRIRNNFPISRYPYSMQNTPVRLSMTPSYVLSCGVSLPPKVRTGRAEARPGRGPTPCGNAGLPPTRWRDVVKYNAPQTYCIIKEAFSSWRAVFLIRCEQSYRISNAEVLLPSLQLNVLNVLNT